jgi:hypothetical protein
MTTEDQIILSFIYKRSGKNTLKESEIYLPLSMNLKWFSLEEAKAFVHHNINQKNLIKKEGMLLPAFGIENISIPSGFRPTKNFGYKNTIKNKEKPQALNEIIDIIAKKTSKTNQEISEEIQKIKKDKKIITEVAAFYIANTYGCDVSFLHSNIENEIFTRNKE